LYGTKGGETLGIQDELRRTAPRHLNIGGIWPNSAKRKKAFGRIALRKRERGHCITWKKRGHKETGEIKDLSLGT